MNTMRQGRRRKKKANNARPSTLKKKNKILAEEKVNTNFLSVFFLANLRGKICYM